MSLHFGGLVVFLCNDCTKVGHFSWLQIEFLQVSYLKYVTAHTQEQNEHKTSK